jgi:putative PEP-CTERM system histidine kinase
VSIGVLSYAAAALAFLALTVLLAAGWEGRAHGGRLIVACAITVLWAALLALEASSAALPASVVVLVEASRYAAWFFVLDGLALAPRSRARQLLGLHAAWLSAVLVLGVVTLMPGLERSPSLPLRLPALAGVVLSLAGLALVWLFHRKSPAESRETLHWLVVALGLAFGFDLLAFVLTLLAGADGLAWQARGIVGVLLVPMIAVAARRNPPWVPKFFVSRQAVLVATGIAIAAAYTALAVVAARMIVRQGAGWGDALQLLFLIVALLALLTLLAAPGPRQRLRVFLSKHFYRSKYDYRAEWLRFIGTLSAGPRDADPRGNAVRSIAQIIASPGGVLYLRGDASGDFVPACSWPVGHHDLQALPVVAAGDAIAGFLEHRQWVIDVHELHARPELYGNLSLPPMFAPPATRRIVLPLLHGERLIGFVVLDDPQSEFHPNFEDRDLLKTVGRHVATYLAQHEADRRLAESRQFEAYHRLTAFVMHDLKNLAAQLSLIVANAERHRRNPEFVDDTITTVANSTQRMQRLIEQLKGREQLELRRAVAVTDAVRRACERCALRHPAPTLKALDKGLYVEAEPEQLTAVFEHLLRNAQDATADDGRVAVSVEAAGDECVVTVADTGCGMSAQFMQERLFKPFDTTKGSQGMGIGAYQVREYVRSLGGTVQVSSVQARGTTFVVRLPRYRG